MTTIDRTTATDAEFVARLDRFAQGVANPPEVLRERLRAEFDRELRLVLMHSVAYEFAGRLADAALAVFPTQQDDAVQRVLAVAGELDGWRDKADRFADRAGRRGLEIDAARAQGRRFAYERAASLIRAALAGSDA